MVGDSIAAIFRHYLEQSERQASRLFATANSQAAVCLFLQKMPDADLREPDTWNRIQPPAPPSNQPNYWSLTP
ncbi:MAG: Hsp33 family molecular chaperone HslO, partial [Betaproteobacteria bacterium]|nr:Hsp33 family molecular chaperone HslO [Betaproteobacteria bacterium]